MFKLLELSGLFFVCLGGLVKIFSVWGQKKSLGCGLLGGVSTQTDNMPLYLSLTCYLLDS